MKELVLKGANGQAITNSLLVAEKFGKQHKNVIQAIKNIVNSAENSAQFYQLDSYVDTSGKENQMYIMNRDGFSLLVMGFTGKQAMRFKIDFIEAFNKMENTIKEVTKPLSTLDLLELTIKGMRENQLELQEVKKDVLELKAQVTTRPDYYTVVGYGTLHGISVNLKQASSIGRKASNICKERGIQMDTLPDPRFGVVKLYPSGVLDEVFSMPLVQKGGKL